MVSMSFQNYSIRYCHSKDKKMTLTNTRDNLKSHRKVGDINRSIEKTKVAFEAKLSLKQMYMNINIKILVNSY